METLKSLQIPGMWCNGLFTKFPHLGNHHLNEEISCY